MCNANLYFAGELGYSRKSIQRCWYNLSISIWSQIIYSFGPCCVIWCMHFILHTSIHLEWLQISPKPRSNKQKICLLDWCAKDCDFVAHLVYLRTPRLRFTSLIPRQGNYFQFYKVFMHFYCCFVFKIHKNASKYQGLDPVCSVLIGLNYNKK